MRLPGGAELRRAEQRRALAGARDRARAGAARGGRPAGHRRRPGRARRRRLRRLGGPRHAGDREHRARRPGRDLAADRELPRLPGRDQRHRADQPRGHPGAQVRRPHRDALPGARRSSPATTATWSGSRRATRSPPARCCSRPAPNTGACRSTDLDEYEGISVFYAAGPPEAQLCGGQRVGVVGGGNSAGPGGGLARPRRRPGHPPAPPRRPQRDDVPLPDRRARPLRRRRPRPQRNRRAARRATASSRRSRSPTATELPLSFLFLFLGASPCTDWLGDVRRPRREGLRPHRRRGRRRRPARDQRPRRLRRRRRPRRLDQALRDRGRRGRGGRALRPRAPRRRRRFALARRQGQPVRPLIGRRVLAGPREVGDETGDRRRQDEADRAGAEREAAAGGGDREPVGDRGAERAGDARRRTRRRGSSSCRSGSSRSPGSR